MQASLRDLASSSHESQSFMICQRTLLKCHEIIFGDLPPTHSPYSTMVAPFRSYFTRTKVAFHVEPALVGLGVVLAGVPGLPQLTHVMGEVAIEQGRVDDEGNGTKSLQVQIDHISTDTSVFSTNDFHEELDDEVDGTNVDKETHNAAGGTSSNIPPAAGNDIAEMNLMGMNILMPRRMPSGAHTTQALPLPTQSVQKLRLSLDPLDQLGSQPNSRPATPSQSSPSILTPASTIHANVRSDEDLLQKYDFEHQRHLLRSHYCRSEV